MSALHASICCDFSSDSFFILVSCCYGEKYLSSGNHTYMHVQQVPSYLDYGTNVCVQLIVTSWAYQYKYCSLNAYVNIIPALLNGSSFQLFQCNGNGTL